jgi:hypothetical protein
MRTRRSVLTLALVLVALILGIASSLVAQQAIVLELFTSEGCSSCPPADALLSQLAKQRHSTNVELILLGEHVEYWNGQGWTDRFSAPTFTQRQYEYVRQLHLATAYTPQVIIDGRLQTVGGNAPAIKERLAEAARTPKPATVALQFVGTDQLQVTVTDSGSAKQRVLLAVTEDNLTTKVAGGENGGKVLVHNAVVRELRDLGTVTNGRFEKTINLANKTDWKRDDLRAIVLVQDASDDVVRGAASLPYTVRTAPAGGR